MNIMHAETGLQDPRIALLGPLKRYQEVLQKIHSNNTLLRFQFPFHDYCILHLTSFLFFLEFFGFVFR